MKITGSGSPSGPASESGSISQRLGSADPDPHKNVMDPEHWYEAQRAHRKLICSLLPEALWHVWCCDKEKQYYRSE
jgi:hypothetical protein